MSTTVETIKDRLNIHDVVSTYLKLEKAGKNFRASCPFHNEKTPSFYVSPERNSYYCFGCGAKGDIFTFVEEFEGLDFLGALKVLADRAGVEVKPVNPEKKGERDRLFEVLEQATIFFEDGLKADKDAQKYLADRGVTEETISSFRLGYVKEDWRSLKDHLNKAGVSDEDLVKVGLIKKSEKADFYDVFRGRIVFPIMDSSGRVVAFSGRVFPEPGDDAKGERTAKYLNSPETELFRKQDLLYGYDKAKSHMRRYDFAILVEGNLDVLLSHQSGYRNAVAALGTSLTQPHFQKIKRLTSNVLLALDADTAGINSASKGTTLALSLGFDVKVAQLPKGKDPADVIQKSPENWRKAIKNAKHIIEFLLDVYESDVKDKRKFRLTVQREVLPYVARIENKIDQAHFVEIVSERAGIPEDAIREEIRRSEVVAPIAQAQAEEERLEHESRRDSAQRRIYGVLLWQKGEKGSSIDALSFMKRLEKLIGKESMENLKGTDAGTLIFEAESLYSDVSDMGRCVEEMMLSLEEDVLRESLADAMMKLREAEEGGDSQKAMKILTKCRDISQEIEKVHQQVQKTF